MKFKIFVLFICLVVAYLSACGLYNSSTDNVFSYSNSNRSGDAGDGDIPRLSERSKSRPDLDDQSCDDDDSCRIVCKAMYADADSEEECVELTYGKVEALEEVYLALRNGETDDTDDNADPNLDDIDFDDLEEYLDIGWDGWLDVVIPKHVRDVDYDKIFNTLKWIADNGGASDALMNVRRDTRYEHNGVLRGLFLNYCRPDSTDSCGANSDVTTVITTSAEVAVGHSIGFDYNNGELQCSTSSPQSKIKIVASITEDRKKELLIALSALGSSYLSGIQSFFNYAAVRQSNDNAFVLAHELLEVACETDSGTSSTKFEQCVRGFYCWLNSQHTGNEINISDFEEVDTDLMDIASDVINIIHLGDNISCTCDDFTAI